MSSDRTPVSGSVEGGTVLSKRPSLIRKRVGNSNEISGEEAFGSSRDENHFLALEIKSYLLPSQTSPPISRVEVETFIFGVK
ncbi:hypothetical protein Pyn_20878 [Prunus yedoensis var. nudiflora]|uniref:Uncharacterized protein n=1 Tax=Prunus yedoensis var. nudiflora TaxID=2094558 RepID=A0A314Z890_PRUYE|nr:hypothetical protein Pyn_20878 [Prunus yedoensis var. nudiflora]